MNLDGDGIILWKEAMRNSLSATAADGGRPLIDLFPVCLNQLESNLDLLGSLLNVVDSYFLLEGPRILEVIYLCRSRSSLNVTTTPLALCK